MILYVNDKNEIKDVNTTSDPSLIALEINDNEENPFKDWTKAKICCYKVTVQDGMVTMMIPYIDSRIIEYMSRLDSEIKELKQTIKDK